MIIINYIILIINLKIIIIKDNFVFLQLHTMMISEHSKGWPGHHQPDTLDGAHHAPGFFKSALIEGRGQYYDPIKGLFLKKYICMPMVAFC